jgi:2,3-dihydroxybenzoate-AMP ligase
VRAGGRERRYLEEGWWTGETLPGFVLRHATGDPGAVAITAPGASLTWGELAARVARAGVAFGELGVRPGERVLVQLPNEPDLIVVILALARIGAAAVLAVPGLRERELSHVTAATAARAIIVNGHAQRGANLAVARQLVSSCRSVRAVVLTGGPDISLGTEHRLEDLLAAASPGTRLPPSPDPAGVALYLLSGGTTGLPKPIPRTHRDYVCNLKVSAAVTGLGSASTYLAALPVCHNFPLGCPGVLGTLAFGGRVVLTEAGGIEGALTAMARERVTITAAVPSLASQWAAAAAGQAPLSLDVLQVGGARLRARHAPGLASAFGCVVQQVYGMAEGMLCFTRLDDPPEVIEGTQGRPASPGDEWRIVGTDGHDIADGTAGELWVRGPYTIGGYLASPKENAAAFAPGGWYRTGDVVRLHPSGNLLVEGRRRDFINKGGEKVSAEEIEELVAAHPAVAYVAAVAVPSEVFGEDICVFAVPRDGGEIGLRELRRFLAGRGIAPYKLPGRLEILPALPLTAVGKVDKAALRALAREE